MPIVLFLISFFKKKAFLPSFLPSCQTGRGRQFGMLLNSRMCKNLTRPWYGCDRVTLVPLPQTCLETNNRPVDQQLPFANSSTDTAASTTCPACLCQQVGSTSLAGDENNPAPRVDGSTLSVVDYPAFASENDLPQYETALLYINIVPTRRSLLFCKHFRQQLQHQRLNRRHYFEVINFRSTLRLKNAFFFFAIPTDIQIGRNAVPAVSTRLTVSFLFRGGVLPE